LHTGLPARPRKLRQATLSFAPAAGPAAKKAKVGDALRAAWQQRQCEQQQGGCEQQQQQQQQQQQTSQEQQQQCHLDLEQQQQQQQQQSSLPRTADDALDAEYDELCCRALELYEASLKETRGNGSA